MNKAQLTSRALVFPLPLLLLSELYNIMPQSISVSTSEPMSNTCDFSRTIQKAQPWKGVLHAMSDVSSSIQRECTLVEACSDKLHAVDYMSNPTGSTGVSAPRIKKFIK